jgi:hypothetical protein
MLKANLVQDYFFGFSVASNRTQDWLEGSGLKPWIWKNRAWCLVVAVSLTQRRSLGLPLLGRQNIVSLMPIVRYRDRQGTTRKGNLLLRGTTDSRALAWLAGFSHWRLGVSQTVIESGEVRSEEFSARIEGRGGAAPNMGPVLRDDHSGVLRTAGLTLYSPLEKSHWEMRPLRVRGWRCNWLADRAAKLEFAFDSSGSVAHWPLWRRARQL